MVGKRRVFRWANAVMYRWVDDSVTKLFRADVCRFDVGKVSGECNCGLSVASGTVPGGVVPWRDFTQIGEQFIGILGSVFGVLVGILGKSLDIVKRVTPKTEKNLRSLRDVNL